MNTAILLAAQAAGQSGGAMPMIIIDGCCLCNHVAFYDSSTTKEAKTNSCFPKCA